VATNCLRAIGAAPRHDQFAGGIEQLHIDADLGRGDGVPGLDLVSRLSYQEDVT
jgi:hypothetical protein